MTDDLTGFLDAAEARLRPRAYHVSGSSYEVLADPDDPGIDWPHPSGYWDDVSAPDVRALVGMVRAVLALCDEAEADHVSLAHDEVRAALLSAIPPTGKGTPPPSGPERTGRMEELAATLDPEHRTLREETS